MDPSQLVQFVRQSVQNGAKKEDITEQLIAVGWSEDEADEAYAQALKDLGVPFPREEGRASFSKRLTTLEVVLNLFSFILLGIVAFAVGTLYFEVIDKYFPDAVADGSSYYYGGSRVSTDAVHYSIAAIVIGFPLFFFVMRFWFRKFREDAGKIESRLTTWVTYLVLLVAAVTIVGDLIATLFTFLQGELSARFFLKAITILGIAGGIFGFYFLERKRVQYKKNISRHVFRIYAGVVAIILLIGIILGFVVTGSPKTERMRTLDAQREQHLSNLSTCIDRYAREYKQLPKSLDDLETASQRYRACSVPNDPETSEQYEYRVITASERRGTVREGVYELCATFALASDDAVTSRASYYGGYGNEDVWHQHGAGRECDEHRAMLETITSTTNARNLPPNAIWKNQ